MNRIDVFIELCPPLSLVSIYRICVEKKSDIKVLWTSFLFPSSLLVYRRLQNSMLFLVMSSIHKHKNVEYNTRLMAKIYKFFSHSLALRSAVAAAAPEKHITSLCILLFSKYNLLLLWFRDICTHFYFYVFYDFRTILSSSCHFFSVIIPIHVQYLNCWLRSVL